MHEDVRKKAWATRSRLAVIGAAGLLVAGLAVVALPAVGAEVDPTPSLVPRSAAPKLATTTLGVGDSREFIQVKFAEGSPVRVRAGNLVATSGADLSVLQQLRAAGKVAGVTRLFPQSEAELAELTASAAARSGRAQADLNQWYRLRVRPGTDPVAVINALNAMPTVETAYAEPLPVKPPSPDYTSRQGYKFAAASSGIDALYARTVAGGSGANVRVHDIEYSWNTQHEDLSKLRAAGAMVPQGTPSDPFNDNNHGTAVAGELVSDDNGSGVTGIVPDARFQMTNATSTAGFNLAGAVTTATRALRAGDVMLLEQQTTGPSGCSGYVAVEWVASVYDAILAATSQGIIVVEAAGNGNMNLDNSCFGNPFPRGRADSGAIIVGAGGAPSCGTARAKLSFSTYGRRVDVQGWGQCVISTGYGNLYGSTRNQWYTATFSGTSSASPIVTGAAAALSSIAKQRGITLTPRDVRARLKATGTAQVNPSTGNIGPLPNLRAAIDALPGGGTTLPPTSNPPTTTPPTSIPPTTTPPTTGPPTGCSGYETTFNGSLSSGASAYHPNNSYFQTNTSGPHQACLDGPAGVDYDLYLQKWNGSAWSNVASGTTSGPDEQLSYNGTAGYYRYRVHAYSGSGSYTIAYNAP